MQNLTHAQAIKLIRRHWKTIGELLDTHHLIDMTSDTAMVALSNYLNATRELDKQLEPKNISKEGK